MGIWLVLPLVTAILLRVFAGDGWRDAGFRPRFKGNIKWYIKSCIIFPAVTVAVTIIGDLFGWIDASNFDIKVFLPVFFGGLAINFVINFFEQSVWMGYLASKLLKLKIRDLWLYILVGAIWGLWHLPYYLVFLPISDIQAVLPVGRWELSLVAIATMIFWAVMFTEVYRITKSIWPVILMHTTEDALINPLVIDGFIEIAQGREILISPITGVITTLLYLAIGLMIRRYRIKKETGLKKEDIEYGS
jgi:membrane protease YdiL (CAAX protease family)